MCYASVVCELRSIPKGKMLKLTPLHEGKGGGVKGGWVVVGGTRGNGYHRSVDLVPFERGKIGDREI